MIDKKEYLRRYNLEHRERIAAQKKAYRLTEKGRMIEKGRTAYKREWRAKNPDKVKVIRLRHQKNHRREIAEWKSWYGKTHRSQINARRREVYKIDPFSALACNHNRRARMAKAGKITAETIQRVYEDNIKRYGTLTCRLCGKAIVFKQDSLDHVIPLFRGGSNRYDNLSVVHRKCNSAKCARTEVEYLVAESGIFDD